MQINFYLSIFERGGGSQFCVFSNRGSPANKDSNTALYINPVECIVVTQLRHKQQYNLSNEVAYVCKKRGKKQENI